MKALLAALEKPGKDYADDKADDAEASGGLDAAAQEIMDAIQAGDVAGLSEALKSFMEMC